MKRKRKIACTERNEDLIENRTERRHKPTKRGKEKNTWRRAGTGLAAIQTACHVLPGISMRELNRPLGI